MMKKHKQTDYFCEQLDNNGLFDQLSITNHAHERHADKTEIDLFERMLDEQILYSSAFDSYETYQYFTQEALYAKMNDILNWRDDPQTKNHETMNFVVNFKDETVGKGFVKDSKTHIIREYETEDVCLVLRKSKENKNIGLDIVTVYPAMFGDDIRQTNKDLRPLMKKTNHFEKATPTKKALLLYQSNPSSKYLATYKAGDYQGDDIIQIRFPTNNPNTENCVFLKEDRYRLKTKHDGDFIQTAYTKAHDIVYPPRSYERQPNVNVNLFNKKLNQFVHKYHPSLITTTDAIMSDIKHYQRKTQSVKETIKTTQQERIKQADQMVSCLTKTNDELEYMV